MLRPRRRRSSSPANGRMGEVYWFISACHREARIARAAGSGVTGPTSMGLVWPFGFYFAESNVGGVPTLACPGLGADGAIGNGELPSSDGGGVGGVGGLAGKIFD